MKRIPWQFRRDTSGAIAVLFALAIIPLMIVVGAGIDLARFYSFRDKLQAGAAEALEQALGGDAERPTRERIESARSTFMALEESQHINPAPNVNVTIHSAGGALDGTITVKANFELAFGKIIGMRTVPMTVVAKGDKDTNSTQSKLMRCHVASAEDVKLLGCGNFF